MLGSGRLARASAALFMTAIVGGALAPGGVAAADRGSTIEAQDSCDAASFNAVLGPGACDPRAGGEVTFGAFVAALGNVAATPGAAAAVLREREFLGWQFEGDSIRVKLGESVEVRNEGGEGHTFSEVTAFGGGCIDFLNSFFSLAPDPRCPAILATVIPPGGTQTVTGLSAGKHLFQCLIHPWMRADVTVGGRHGRDD